MDKHLSHRQEGIQCFVKGATLDRDRTTVTAAGVNAAENPRDWLRPRADGIKDGFPNWRQTLGGGAGFVCLAPSGAKHSTTERAWLAKAAS